MKKYIRNILIFFVAVLAIDVAFGCVCRYLNSHAKGGDTKNHYHIAMNMKADVLLFGSSRCIHHYNPQIISDSLGMTTYNCGEDGNGILYLYSRLQIILNRHTPKVIIYDIADGFDLKADDYSKYLGWQRRYYDIHGVSEIFDDINPMERYKMYSQLYRYNSDFIQMLSDNVHPKQQVSDGGYKPVNKKMAYTPKDSDKEPEAIEWDALKKKYFTKFYDECNKRNIKFIVAYSPRFHAKSIKSFTNMTVFCKANNIPLLNHYTDSAFVNNKDYFYDASHMNVEGAEAFTKRIAAEVKAILDL